MKRVFLGLVGGIVVVVAATTILPRTTIAEAGPFGGADDIAYAESLWNEIEAVRIVGPNAMRSRFYEGSEPHGFILEVFDTDATINDHTGRLVIKKNYGPEGVDREEASNNPDGHLAAITVMFRREAGYDEDNQNWFWAKYRPDGTLDQNPAGMQLAGRVAKGADAGCIACHTGADGDDYLFFTNRSD